MGCGGRGVGPGAASGLTPARGSLAVMNVNLLFKEQQQTHIHGPPTSATRARTPWLVLIFTRRPLPGGWGGPVQAQAHGSYVTMTGPLPDGSAIPARQSRPAPE